MKKLKLILLPIISLAILVIACSSTSKKTDQETSNTYQSINLFVTHGHCSLPFSGKIYNLNVDIPKREDGGNPLENLSLNFEIDPQTFFACSSDENTAKVRTSGLFFNEKNKAIKFQSTNIYTMGFDWYQINGNLTIKGVEKEVKFFASGIRDPKESMSTMLIIEGQVNLFDWGIDYDKIANGESKNINTKWLHLNLKIDLS